MKKFVGKMLYFFGECCAEVCSMLMKTRILSEKTAWNGISRGVDLMDYSVVRLMGEKEYRNFRVKGSES